MRVVYVTSEFPPHLGGGIGTYIDAISTALAADGHDITVITPTPDAAPARQFIAGRHVIRLPLTPACDNGPLALLRRWQEWSDTAAEALTRLCQTFAPDIIEFPEYRGEALSFLSARPQNSPLCIVRLHTPSSVLFRYNPSQKRSIVLEEFELESIRLADRIVSPSAALIREIAPLLSTTKTIDLSPHPVDPAFLAASPTTHTDNSTEILYVGRLEERKGVETLIRAARRIFSASPTAGLTLIGGDTPKGPAQPSMRETLRNSLPADLAARVEFVDTIPRDRLLERYRAARLCVFPSHFENFPNTCLEAMALGQCVVASDNSGMAELIDSPACGRITRAADADALAAAVIEMFQLPTQQRAAIGSAARMRITMHYSPDRIAARQTDLYQWYLNEQSPANSHRSPVHPRAIGTVPLPRSSPRCAVVIPCFNHGRFLADAVASVRAQSHADTEIIIVNDGSTDTQTLAALDQQAAADVRVIHQPNAGLAAARNAGIRAGDAPFFVALDADDRLDPHFIEKLLAPLLADPSLGYSYSHVEFFGDQTGAWNCPEFDPQKLLIENLSVATAVVRRRAFDEVAGYSTDMIHGFEDWDFWLALLSLGWHGRMIPEPLFYYRKHAAGSMLTETQKRRAEMVQQMIAHHRRLFAHRLEASIVGKDGQFFREHIHAAKFRDALISAGASPAALAPDDELYQRLLAQAELDAIESSRFWRTFRRLGISAAHTDAAADPRARLHALKNSTPYRAIQLIKSNFIYRWYARGKYGNA